VSAVNRVDPTEAPEPTDLDATRVLHYARTADILEAIANDTKVVTLCGVRRRPTLPVTDRPVCEACALIAVGIR
jgi:hypothetical protein